MFAMLLAMALCRAARPAAATRREDDEISSNTAAPWMVGPGRRSVAFPLSNPCSYHAVRPGPRSAERVTVAARLHPKGPGVPWRGVRDLGGSHGAVDVDRPFDRLPGLDPGGHGHLLA